MLLLPLLEDNRFGLVNAKCDPESRKNNFPSLKTSIWNVCIYYQTIIKTEHNNYTYYNFYMLYLISLYFCSTKYIIYNNFSEYHISEFYKKSFATTTLSNRTTSLFLLLYLARSNCYICSLQHSLAF